MLELEQIILYKNKPVLARYERDYPQNRMTAEEALLQLIKFFWLCQQHSKDKLKDHNEALEFNCMMHEEMSELDDMWHTFLLFTKEYQEFCYTHFGDFIHHAPLTEENKLSINQNYDIELERFLSYTYDKLGSETVTQWFHNCF